MLEVFATKRRDRRAVLKFLTRTMKLYGRPKVIVTDRLRSYRPPMKVIGNAVAQECGRRSTTGRKTRISRSDDEKERWRSSGT
ncbi:MAG: DDE-type integrase/transposase/recombinase [Gammaproteobacteria bacterium]|nr:DDE-type integrase/transposase/recombinase [Gammaproteobacteria bacterium]